MTTRKNDGAEEGHQLSDTIEVTLPGRGTYHIAFTFDTLLELEETHGIAMDSTLQEKGMRGQMMLILVALQKECDPTITEADVKKLGLAAIARIGRDVSTLFQGTATPLESSNGATPTPSLAST